MSTYYRDTRGNELNVPMTEYAIACNAIREAARALEYAADDTGFWDVCDVLDALSEADKALRAFCVGMEEYGWIEIVSSSVDEKGIYITYKFDGGESLSTCRITIE